MSMRFWLKDIITVERQTTTKDSSGAAVNGAWAAISASTTNIRACHWKASEKAQKMNMDFGREDWRGDFVWVTEVDCAAKAGDRINHNGVYYQIHDGFNYGHDAITTQVVYVMDTSLVRSSSGTT